MTENEEEIIESKVYQKVKKYTALTNDEINFLHNVSIRILTKNNSIVIAGTYKGGDAMAIRIATPKTNIIVIDSFQGLANPVKEDKCDSTMIAGEFNCGGIDRYIQNFNEVKIKQPDSIIKEFISKDSKIKIPKNTKVIWLDLDHYLPTKIMLNLVKETILNNDGLIITHDYGFERCPGIKKACDEFGGDWTHCAGGIYGFNVKSILGDII